VATEQELKEKVALSCQILAQHGLVKGSTGHVSCRVPGENHILVRGRPGVDRGLRFAPPESIMRVDLDGNPVGDTGDVSRVREIFLHTEIYRRRPEVNCVIHAHPPAVILCTIMGVPLRLISATEEPQFRRMLLAGEVPLLGRTITLHTREQTLPMLDMMGSEDVCLMRAHGITAVGTSIERATGTALAVENLARLNWNAALLGRPVPEIPQEDKDEFGRRLGAQAMAPAGDGEGGGWDYLTALLETGLDQPENRDPTFRGV